MQQIIIYRQRLRITVTCPECKQYIHTYADTLFQNKKFTCYKCGKKSDLAKLICFVDIWRYFNFFLKLFMKPNKEGKLEDSIELVCPNVDNKAYKNDFDRLLKFIDSCKIGWEIKETKERMVKIDVCPNCVICLKCGKLSKPKDKEGHKVCGECGHWGIKHVEAKDGKCPNCGNTALDTQIRKTIYSIVSVEKIRRFMYSKKDLAPLNNG